jgi:ADP-ribose pyrophosphatase YjhB (NUDIX family)
MNSPHRPTPVKGSHCSYCGSKFAEQVLYPRKCWTCHNDTWANPLPVVVALIQVYQGNGKAGVLIAQRNIEPGKGKMAFPGGYIDLGETWQQACAREVGEEIGLATVAEGYRLLTIDMGSNNNTLLIFADYYHRVPMSEIEFCFSSNAETSSVSIAFQPQELAFPTHTKVLNKYLNTLPYYFSTPL